MIEFEGDKAIVVWEIETDNGVNGRREVKMPLVDYLALVKVSTTLTELRARVFMHIETCKQKRRRVPKATRVLINAATNGAD